MYWSDEVRLTSRISCIKAIAVTAALALMAIAIWQVTDDRNQVDSATQTATEIRIAARALEDGRTEVTLQQRSALGWGEYIAPDARFLRVDAEVGRRYHSSPVVVGADRTGPGPLKIALLQTTVGTDQERRRSFKLAIEHINQAGGVFGQPVVGVIADINFDTDFAVDVARRLVEEEGVHAFVGPNTSSASLAVIEAVIKTHEIPTISPSATAPALTEADDADFFFRAVPSDSAQGPVLAQLAREQGNDTVGLVYWDDAWGRGLAGTFRSAWTGGLSVGRLDQDADSCVDALQQAAADNANTLVVLTFQAEATLCVGQALELGLFEHFLFGDAAQSLAISEQLGPEAVASMQGTAATSGEANESSRYWERTYADMWGTTPGRSLSYIRAVYDATIALALAAQITQSTDGAAIRDQLRSVSDGQGQTYSAEQLADAFHALANGEAIDYLGVESSLAWDEHGDVTRFQIGIWQFTDDGQIEIIRRIPFDLSE